jgi:hypothetical protein
MSIREVIAEFILQGIKQGDLVEFKCTQHRVIRGYVLDKDVFKHNFQDDIKKLRAKLYGYNEEIEKVITVKLEIKKIKPDPTSIMDSFLFTSQNYTPPINIHPEDIISIQKQSEAGAEA